VIIGSSISHYKIVEKLGEGGMGVVYKAEDTTLERSVALKFLADHLMNDEEAKKRFLREAKAAAALHHPNICPVYEIAEADGKTFISMAYIEGETLEDKIAKGPLAIREALEIGQQIAKGLQAAHEKAIVHRDIKPANIMISKDGQVTIMDFGLARLTEASRLTKVDTAMGTVAYMSPEQAQGMEVDSRSDIWALGCVLYEMVAGQRPFQGQYDQALLYEIVQEQPAPLTGLRTAVPMELEFIVGKCLAKDRKDRTATAQEVGRELRTLSDKLKSGRSTILRTTAGGRAPRWSRDGKELFYAAPGPELVAVQVSTEGEFAVKNSTTLFQAAGSSGGYDISLDGQRFLTTEPADGEAAAANSSIGFVQNWPAKYLPQH
jgi:serine/threonine protein kinase